MTGTLALHGGGEFEPGDEPFLTALVEAARDHADGRPIVAVVVPTAAARGRPGLAGEHGTAALTQVAASLGIGLVASVVPVVDADTAADPVLAARLAAADLIYLPGGDPDVIPAALAGGPAGAAIATALEGGAIVAGASAGAMGLAELTWTPAGIVAGLGAVEGFLVVPHADADSWASNLRRFGGGNSPKPVGLLGLAERTGVIGPGDGRWQVVGEGEVRWLPVGRGTVPGDLDPDAAIVFRDGDRLDTR